MQVVEFFQEFKSEYAVLIVRIVAGILFLSQGYDKLFRIGLKLSGDAAVDALLPLGLPPSLVRFITSLTAVLEFTCGLLLIPGLFILPSCYILAAVMLPVTIAMSLREPLWNMSFVWPRLVLIIFLLWVNDTAHRFSLDYLFGS